MPRIQLSHTYDNIISLENLLLAWKEFIVGKKSRKDVQEFERNLMTNIISLHQDLVNKRYKHSQYEAFKISDPKPRDIHKAKVRDRLLHHAIYRVLYPFFNRTFIADSFSCRLRKGTHKAIDRFRSFAYQVSKNHTKTVWVLKCDIRKFFASINQTVMMEIIKEYIPDADIVSLLSEIVGSFFSTQKGRGLPLGNLTSQLLVNIYMNRFDQFMKHKVKAKHYIRYADDFVILSDNKEWLISILPEIGDFLKNKLNLHLHPKKVSLTTIASGVDYLGWVLFPDHRVCSGKNCYDIIGGINSIEGRNMRYAAYCYNNNVCATKPAIITTKISARLSLRPHMPLTGLRLSIVKSAISKKFIDLWK